MKIEIYIKPDGQIIVSGNINETIVCLGLLEVAKDIIKAHGQKMVMEQANKIIRPEFISPKGIAVKN